MVNLGNRHYVRSPAYEGSLILSASLVGLLIDDFDHSVLDADMKCIAWLQLWLVVCCNYMATG